MEQYNVTGMSCAACSARVEKAVSKVPGSRPARSVCSPIPWGWRGRPIPRRSSRRWRTPATAPPPEGAAPSARAAQGEEALADHDTPVLKKRLISSLVFLAVLMYFSMGPHHGRLAGAGLFPGGTRRPWGCCSCCSPGR